MRKEPGRLRWKMSDMLRELGIECSPYDIWTQEGAYRGPKWDLAPWGATGKWINPVGKQYPGKLIIEGCDTLTQCGKYGIHIATPQDADAYQMSAWDIEVHRGQPATN